MDAAHERRRRGGQRGTPECSGDNGAASGVSRGLKRSGHRRRGRALRKKPEETASHQEQGENRAHRAEPQFHQSTMLALISRGEHGE